MKNFKSDNIEKKYYYYYNRNFYLHLTDYIINSNNDMIYVYFIF